MSEYNKVYTEDKTIASGNQRISIPKYSSDLCVKDFKYFHEAKNLGNTIALTWHVLPNVTFVITWNKATSTTSD